MQTYDLTQPLKDIRGQVIAINEAGESRAIGELIADALLTDVPSEQATGVEKLRRFTLAQRIVEADGPVELSPKDVTEIDARCAKVLSTLAYGQIAAVLGTADSA